MAHKLNIITDVQALLKTYLKTNVTWINNITYEDREEIGIPDTRRQFTLQVVCSANPWGQEGGMLCFDVTIELACMTRSDQDSEGKRDALLKLARTRLSEVQDVLEGQSLDYLEIPLYTDVGPSRPEIFNVDPLFGFSYLSLSGTKHLTIAEAKDIDWGDYDQGFDTPS